MAAMNQQPPPKPPAGQGFAKRRAVVVVSAAAGLCWAWSLGLLSTRHHLVDFYHVLASAPPLWGPLVLLPVWKLAAIFGLGLLLAAAVARVGLAEDGAAAPAARWLLACLVFPALDALRAAGIGVPYTFWEPLLLSFLTGMAASSLARRWRPAAGAGQPAQPLADKSRAVRAWLGLIVILSFAAGGWWYYEAAVAFRDYLLGYHDFGHFALRVVNTWEGRGWLMETPSLPAFWDHFNPGLALLAPLWGLWPDARVFMALQAFCLASPAPLVFGIARRCGAESPVAAAWSVVYLVFPSVGLLNLCYSYGWHPVSLALPLLVLAAWWLVRGRPLAALLAALLACSFKETVVVALGCLSAALAIQAWLARRRRSAGWRMPLGNTRLAECLPPAGWIAGWAVLVAAFCLIAAYSPFTRFQTSRFSALGESPGEILMAPLLRPAVFWGQLLRPVSAWFVLGLLVPWHLPALLRGWPILLAACLPVAVLLAWDHGPAYSIAFQYVTELIAVLLLAAVCGGSRGAEDPASPSCGADGADELSRWRYSAAAGALGASLTASWLFGSLPWSGETLTLMRARSYPTSEAAGQDNPRAAGTPGHAALEAMVSRVGTSDAAVLATGRVAAHLLGVRRLEAVDEGLNRWSALDEEAGPDRSAIELFDWVLLDTREHFQQSPDRIMIVLAEALRAGYVELQKDEGLILLGRPPEVRKGDR